MIWMNSICKCCTIFYTGGQRKKKDSQAEDSDEDPEHSPVSKHMQNSKYI
jgi:hypothetical protein